MELTDAQIQAVEVEILRRFKLNQSINYAFAWLDHRCRELEIPNAVNYSIELVRAEKIQQEVDKFINAAES